MSNKLKRVKKMTDVKPGDKVLLVPANVPEVVVVDQTYDNRTRIEGRFAYMTWDDDLDPKQNGNVKVYKVVQK